jgi:mono/diheme cytochrome c family protein
MIARFRMLYSPEIFVTGSFVLKGETRMKFARIVLTIVALAMFAMFAVACADPGPEISNRSQPAVSASPVSTAAPDELATARTNFAKHCAVCHGAEGNGGLVKIGDKSLKVPSLRSGHALDHPDEKFVKQITNGGDGMPKFEDKLTPEEINDLVRFIRKELQGK